MCYPGLTQVMLKTSIYGQHMADYDSPYLNKLKWDLKDVFKNWD